MQPLMRNSLQKDKIRVKLRWMKRERFATLTPYEKYRRHILSVRNEVYRQRFLGITDLSHHSTSLNGISAMNQISPLVWVVRMSTGRYTRTLIRKRCGV